MAKLKPVWMLTDIPKPVKIKLWRLMKDYPTYRSWIGAVTGKAHDNAEQECLTDDQAQYVRMSPDTYQALKGELRNMPVEEVAQLPPDLQSFVRQLRPDEVATDSREDQSKANLPPWLNQAQERHIEGEERQVEMRTAIGLITRRITGIRQKLEAFRECFGDIDPRGERFWFPPDEETMTQLHGHLPDEAFWLEVEGPDGFKMEAGKCEALLDAARRIFTSAVGWLALPQSPEEFPAEDRITSEWANQVLNRALSPKLGFQAREDYYTSRTTDGRVVLYHDVPVYIGPDYEKAEEEHRRLVADFAKSEECEQILALMKHLRDMRQRIIARIDQCLRRQEYSVNYCPDCPAIQARSILGSQQDD